MYNVVLLLWWKHKIKQSIKKIKSMYFFFFFFKKVQTVLQHAFFFFFLFIHLRDGITALLLSRYVSTCSSFQCIIVSYQQMKNNLRSMYHMDSYFFPLLNFCYLIK